MGIISKERHLFFLNNSVSIDSGGRVQSMFLRSKTLEEDVTTFNICTFNFRPNYRNQFESIHEVKKLPKNLFFRNIYEFFAEDDTLFLSTTIKKIDEYEQKEKFIQSTKNENLFEYKKNNQLLERIKINLDKSIALIDYFEDKKRIKREIFRSDGILLRANYFNSDGFLVQSDFFASDGRKYLASKYNEEAQMTYILHFQKNGNVNQFDNEKQLKDYWIFQLNEMFNTPYFFVEDHRLDSCVIENNFTNKIVSIATIHGNIYGKDGSFGNPLKSYTKGTLENLDKFSAVILLTEEIKKHITSQFGERDNLFVIGHPFFANITTEPLTKDLRRGVIISKFIKRKRVTLAIKAFAKVVKEVPDAQLDIFGHGDEKQNYELLIKKLGVEKNIHVYGYTQDAVGEFQRSGFSLMTSKTEGFGISILESLSVNTPVIAFDYSYGPKDLIENDVNGYIIPNGDVDALSRKIIKLLKNPELLKKLSQNTEGVVQRYAKPIIREKLLSLLNYVDEYQDELPVSIQSINQVISIDKKEDRSIYLDIELNLKLVTEEIQPKCYIHVTAPGAFDKMDSTLYQGVYSSEKFKFNLSIPFEVIESILKYPEEPFTLGVQNKRHYQMIKLPKIKEEILSFLN
ncbi:glycosyltransferase [Enterococcus thailandicus]|uniref:glycosyltransferase n=1 Tax=Enterococcus thailandicus TaxID=417368 RepID=UPI002542E55F|nr:glycosyltransferase [Enterococcus thailandicus]MDK4352787.1 glycosyltransferase [Enterococcus thailandicus]MDT2734859.1 glycosyltransferase [Enterococcus thailandicus]MEA4828386.1 glycosyltransferase [Enterococcus thailandicus]